MTVTSDAPHPEAQIELAAQITAAYVSHNSVPFADLPGLLTAIYAALNALATGSVAVAASPAPETGVRATPAQIKKSITPDALISFIDGKPYKTLKRHLTSHGLEPGAYRQRFGLPSDYPMVSPSYSEQRSALAKAIGLGVPGNRAAGEAAAKKESLPQAA